MLLVFAWTTIVYDPVAHWTWSPLGWDYILGGLDYVSLLICALSIGLKR